jgi:succinate dehydrogenase / fumarate reductase, cytochrome b subunit
MNSPVAFYQSTIGKKIIMAVTGVIGIGFLIAHVAGNLQAFVGADKFNAYSAMLHGPLNELLWVLRLVLIVSVILHVMMAWQLTQRAHAARPIGYHDRKPQVSTLASRTMRWGGVLIVVFIVFHILHFTLEAITPGGAAGLVDNQGHRDVYANVVASFRVWWVSLFYIVTMVFIGLHLYHGSWSSLRTLGYAKPSLHPMQRRIALAIAVIVWLGFTLVPVGVIAGIIR